MHYCTRCRKAKAESQFGKRGTGLRSWCRKCEALASRMRYLAEETDRHHDGMTVRNRYKRSAQERWAEIERIKDGEYES